MVVTRRKFFYEMFKLFDVFAILFCLFISVVLSYNAGGLSEVSEILTMRLSVNNFITLFTLSIIWHYILRISGFYSSHRFYTIEREIKEILKGSLLIAATFFCVQVVYPMSIFNLSMLHTFWVSTFLMLAISRFALRSLLVFIRKRGRNLKCVLFVGSNKRALKYAKNLTSNPAYGYKIIGFVDNHWHGTTIDNQSWCKLVADFETFPEFLRRNVVDEIFLFLPLKSNYETISNIILASEDQGVTVRMGLDLFNLRLAHGLIEQVQDDDVLLTLYTGAMRRNTVFFKHFIDRILAAVLILILLPLFALTALMIKISSKGPVFFKQKRIGYNKRVFWIYKFRTMDSGAEAKLKELEHLNEMGVNAGAFKMKNDPRITPVGKILRKFSIDELPQLFNVVLGEMSFVGPRPLTERDYQFFRLHRQIRRFSVKPGITCLWQIGGRNDISFDEWMELDMKYIDGWSLALDMSILLKTIPAVLTGKGAS